MLDHEQSRQGRQLSSQLPARMLLRKSFKLTKCTPQSLELGSLDLRGIGAAKFFNLEHQSSSELFSLFIYKVRFTGNSNSGETLKKMMKLQI